MTIKRYILATAVCCMFSVSMYAQEAAAVDSLRAAMGKAVTLEQKFPLMEELSRVLMNVNPKQADETGTQLITLAEESRDRKYMFKAYLSNGTRCSYMASQKVYSDKALSFYNKALELARQNRLTEETGIAQQHLAMFYLLIPDKEKAFSYITQASSLTATLSNDSLRAESFNIFGQVYQAKNENILALRSYLNGLRLAEELKNSPLIRNCYLYLSDFYADIEDYDKAIDYTTLAYKILESIKEKNVPYQKVIYTNNLGNLFAKKKNYDIAISYFERSIRMADSLKFSTLKIPGYVSLLNQYLRMDEPQKALNYLNSKEGNELKKYLTNFGMSAVIDQAYGVVYTGLGRFDSAGILLEKARPMFENGGNEYNKVGFIAQLATYYNKSGNYKMAISHYLQVKDISERNGWLENVEKAAKYLDTLYSKTGNLQESGKYNALYYQYKDSIKTLKRENEMRKEEADDEQQRLMRAQKEAEEIKKRRNNIQYLAIVIGIISLFVSMVILGMFKVSAGVIRAVGFFVFLMFFEFIFLIFKKNIYSITQGEPWKDLAFMIALAAILVPLHHWLEHKVLHYLTSHNRLTSAGFHLKKRIFGGGGE
ncbi:MAG: tetratricopeptide repeat protein [Chitinophagales bacterium]|nr:tetratricopeptide repeat protein [Chitinophagales bacterium]